MLGFGIDGMELQRGHRSHQGLHDYFKKDFTFDLVYHFKPGDTASMLVGVGEVLGLNGIGNAVAAHLQGPGARRARWTSLFSMREKPRRLQGSALISRGRISSASKSAAIP